MKPLVISVASGLPRPRFRGWVHTWAFAVSVPAAIVLWFLADQPGARIGVGIYGVCLMAVFGVSAAYHRLAISERAQTIMQRFDHATIFLMIAGTYTPVCLVALPPRWWIPLLSVIWAGAVIGVGCKLLGSERIQGYSSSLYLVLGWVALVGLPSFVRHLSVSALGLMVVGGVLYTVGAIFFWLQRPDPAPLVFGYHEVWHVFTVLAGASHFAMVAVVVV